METFYVTKLKKLRIEIFNHKRTFFFAINFVHNIFCNIFSFLKIFQTIRTQIVILLFVICYFNIVSLLIISCTMKNNQQNL